MYVDWKHEEERLKNLINGRKELACSLQVKYNNVEVSAITHKMVVKLDNHKYKTDFIVLLF
jgi:hypothetical protein